MICILFSIIISLLVSFAMGFIIFFFIMVEPVYNFFFIQIPIVKFATIETFIECGLFIKLLLKIIFKNNRFIEIIGILLVIGLAITSLYISFNTPLSIVTTDIPIISNLYNYIYRFFSFIVKKISEFYLG